MLGFESIPPWRATVHLCFHSSLQLAFGVRWLECSIRVPRQATSCLLEIVFCQRIDALTNETVATHGPAQAVLVLFVLLLEHHLG